MSTMMLAIKADDLRFLLEAAIDAQEYLQADESHEEDMRFGEILEEAIDQLTDGLPESWRPQFLKDRDVERRKERSTICRMPESREDEA